MKDANYIKNLIVELVKYPNETEWIEFKYNNSDPHSIGEYISALSNSAALQGKSNAYLLWGVDDSTHDLLGTSFEYTSKKVGNEELENWLLRGLTPKIDFTFHSIKINEKNFVLLEIKAAYRHPVSFNGVEFLRVGTLKKKLKEFPDKERELWKIFDSTPFEKQNAMENISKEEVLRLINYASYFEMLEQTVPDGHKAILEILEADEIISKSETGNYNISNFGAILFATDLKKFKNLRRKSIRVIQYEGISRINTLKEQEGVKGYATGFQGLIEYLLALLPSNELIKSIRKNVPMFPPIAIRELVANALIHQDFFIKGTGPTIEIFSNRIEITNPGIPLVKTERFLDNPPKSRNEDIASMMRRVGICEERGSGIDKIVFETELYQLPAPLFEVTDEHTRIVLFAYKDFWEMNSEEKNWACYLHACLKFVQREYMTNASLRERFGVEDKNSAAISRVIKETLEQDFIAKYDENAGKKYVKYIPYWAKQ